jgi:hypothetical protein
MVGITLVLEKRNDPVPGQTDKIRGETGLGQAAHGLDVVALQLERATSGGPPGVRDCLLLEFE